VRTAFIESLTEIAAKRPDLWLVTGDLGYSVLEPFAGQFPERYLNAGVAEQNMMGMAAGLALSGKLVFVYSIANFPTIRCLEQVRNDIVYHRANVKIISIGGGFTYGPQGYTHYALEDFAIMGAFAGITVLAPGDAAEVRALVPAIATTEAPVYMRLGRANEPRVHDAPVSLEIGRSLVVQDGTDVTLIATGSMLHPTVEAARELEADGISARVLSMHTVSPIDRAAIAKAARETGAIVTVEEHMAWGGLGTRVADTMAEDGLGARLVKHAARPAILQSVGSQSYMRRQMGSIVQSVYRVISGRSCAVGETI